MQKVSLTTSSPSMFMNYPYCLSKIRLTSIAEPPSLAHYILSTQHHGQRLCLSALLPGWGLALGDPNSSWPSNVNEKQGGRLQSGGSGHQWELLLTCQFLLSHFGGAPAWDCQTQLLVIPHLPEAGLPSPSAADCCTAFDCLYPVCLYTPRVTLDSPTLPWLIHVTRMKVLSDKRRHRGTVGCFFLSSYFLIFLGKKNLVSHLNYYAFFFCIIFLRHNETMKNRTYKKKCWVWDLIIYFDIYGSLWWLQTCVQEGTLFSLSKKTFL